jgi:hypothetical protein
MPRQVLAHGAPRAKEPGMSGPPAPALVSWGIGALAVGLGVAFVAAHRAAARALGLPPSAVRAQTATAAALVAAWMLAFALVARAGWLARFAARPPPLLLALAAIVAGTVLYARSAAAGRLAAGLPLAALVGYQAYRLPLELVMHEAARAGLMPAQMTYTGWNLDIVSGVTAALVAPAVAFGRAPRALVLAWNALGLALVLWVLGIGIASMPAIRAFGAGAENTWIAYFPFVWLPAVLVPAAILGHVLVFRRLASEHAPRTSPDGTQPGPRAHGTARTPGRS